jgi:hypothetical protein
MMNARVLFRAAVALLILMTWPGGARAGEPRGADAAIHQVGLVWLKSAGDANSRQKVIAAVHEFARSIP